MVGSNLRLPWEPSEAAFHRLLAWLDEEADSQGERYLEIRHRLVLYFARRNCPAPEDLADETLNRVARRLEETGSIDDIVPRRYCYIVAKFVFLESLRERVRMAETALDDDARETLRGRPAGGTVDERERTFGCLDRCLQNCAPLERELILDYYGTEAGSASAQRKRLAERHGLTANSLAIRACRIRSRLESCVRACTGR